MDTIKVPFQKPESLLGRYQSTFSETWKPTWALSVYLSRNLNTYLDAHRVPFQKPKYILGRYQSTFPET